MVHAPTLMLGAVLAGGQSSRMGSDKALLRLPDGRTLLDYSIWSYSGVCPAVAVCAPAGRYETPDPGIGRRIAIEFVPDLRTGCGPLAGVEAAMHWAAHCGATWLLTRPVDAPFVPASWLVALVRRATEARRMAAFIGGTPNQGNARSKNGQPLCAAWNISLLQPLGTWLDNAGRSAFAAHEDFGSLAVAASELGPAAECEQAMLNINTPEDLAHLKSL